MNLNLPKGFWDTLTEVSLFYDTFQFELIKSNKRNENGPAVWLRICTSSRFWRNPGPKMVTKELISTTSLIFKYFFKERFRKVASRFASEYYLFFFLFITFYPTTLFGRSSSMHRFHFRQHLIRRKFCRSNLQSKTHHHAIH